MASGQSSWLQRNILFKIPFLYKRCPEGNYHKIFDRLCYCRCNEHSYSDGKEWHGGIYDFKTGDELQFCTACIEKEKEKRINPKFKLIQLKSLKDEDNENI